MRALILLAACACLYSQEEPLHVGPGVKPPKLTHKVEPEYSPEARGAYIQGNVVIEIVVNQQGRASEITLVSPIGFGLDERAIAAVEQWRFHPGTKDGKPVKIRAIIDVSFRFPGLWFDGKTEQQRTEYNIAAHDLLSSEAKSKAHAIETIQKLSRQQFPPAMFSESKLIEDGTITPADPTRVLELLTKSAARNHGPAMFGLGKRYLGGSGVNADPEKGMNLIRNSALLGSTAAQFHLGARYENADGVPKDLERAQRYFRLCAASGEPLCQFRLARLLLDAPDRRDHQYVQAIAWLQLAAAKLADASALLDNERPRISAEQLKWADQVRPQLVRKQ